MTSQAPANWYPDPFGRQELRYWDGERWSEHVISRGRQAVDPPTRRDEPPTGQQSRKVKRQVRRMGASTGALAGGGTLFTEPVLVFNQKAKLVEVNVEHAIYCKNGRQVGAVREVGQSMMKKMVGAPHSRRPHSFEVVDMHGQVLLRLNRPVRLLRSRMAVTAGDGAMIGQISQRTLDIGAAIGLT